MTTFVRPDDANVTVVLGRFGGSARSTLFAARRRLPFSWPLVGIVSMLVFSSPLAFVEGRLAS